MKLAKQQSGMGLIGWMFMIILVGFVAMFLIRLAPVYMEYFTIRSVLQGFAGEGGQYASAEGVRTAVAKRFNINDVKHAAASDVIIEPTGGGYRMQLDYEVRVPFMANISFVVNFSETGEVRGGSEFAQ